MNTTKIKRISARFGIGSPLNQLIYTSDEIKKMIASGELLDSLSTQGRGRPKGSLDTYPRIRKSKHEIKYPTFYRIKSGNILVSKKFTTWEEAYEWAEWNYKGNLNKIDIVNV